MLGEDGWLLVADTEFSFDPCSIIVLSQAVSVNLTSLKINGKTTITEKPSLHVKTLVIPDF